MAILFLASLSSKARLNSTLRVRVCQASQKMQFAANAHTIPRNRISGESGFRRCQGRESGDGLFSKSRQAIGWKRGVWNEVTPWFIAIPNHPDHRLAFELATKWPLRYTRDLTYQKELSEGGQILVRPRQSPSRERRQLHLFFEPGNHLSYYAV